MKRALLPFIILTAVTLSFNAYSAETYEAIAKVRETIGFETSYNVGMVFKSLADCQEEVAKINRVIGNLTAQGALPNTKPMLIECAQSHYVQLGMKN